MIQNRRAEDDRVAKLVTDVEGLAKDMKVVREILDSFRLIRRIGKWLAVFAAGLYAFNNGLDAAAKLMHLK